MPREQVAFSKDWSQGPPGCQQWCTSPEQPKVTSPAARAPVRRQTGLGDVVDEYLEIPQPGVLLLLVNAALYLRGVFLPDGDAGGDNFTTCHVPTVRGRLELLFSDLHGDYCVDLVSGYQSR